MHKWTNDTTGHNRTISTGPTPGGELDNFCITVGYVMHSANPNPQLSRDSILDNHIIPLILRVPEMRDTLAACLPWLEEYNNKHYGGREVGILIDEIRELIAPTREEESAQKHGA